MTRERVEKARHTFTNEQENKLSSRINSNWDPSATYGNTKKLDLPTAIREGLAVKTVHLTLMMTSAQVVETSVNVTSNSPSQDYTHPDDHNLPKYYFVLLTTYLSLRTNKLSCYESPR